MKSLPDLLDAAIAIARVSGNAILEVYAGEFSVRSKEDASPITVADERSDAVIVEALQQLEPRLPIVTEERAAPLGGGDTGDRYWLVDPLDGTKEFIARNGEFTVNIALIDRAEPVLGVVFAPAFDRLYAGAAGAGAFLHDAAGRRRITARAVPEAGMTIVSSRTHGDPDALERFLCGRSVCSTIVAGSSLKFCLVAAGEADLYPRFGRTMEWDTAAGHAVLAAAGGRVTDLEGWPLRYGKPRRENPAFVAEGRDAELD